MQGTDGKEWSPKVPCQNACPLHMDIPGYIALIAEGRYREAYAVIRGSTPFPSVCGRICHRPCEVACLRSKLDEPVAINALKRFVAERSAGEEIVTPGRGGKNRRVAVIGAGPAGLTAAHDLAGWGYAVTVFEAQPVAGGMLSLGIPDFRLPKREVALEVELIGRRGVDIRLNMAIGRGLTIGDLLGSAYEAVFIATGAHRARELGVPGEQAIGVVEALALLRRVNLGEREKPGEKVVVVGEGYSAFDAARVAVRLGSRVRLVCRGGADEIAAPRWEADAAAAEGIEIHFRTQPVRVLGDNDRVAGLECVAMAPKGMRGEGQSIPPQDAPFVLEADVVVNAVGEEAGLSFLPRNEGLQTVASTLRVEAETLQCSRAGIYAGGDVVTGPRTVVEAIEAGHRAASSIQRYLKGRRALGPSPDRVELEELTSIRTDRSYDSIRRQEMPCQADAVRRSTFGEVELGYDEERARREAKRCLQCNIHVGFNAEECIVCGRCAEVCPYDCLTMVDHAGQEFQPRFHRKPWLLGRGMLKDDSLCIRCGICKQTCPVHTGMTLRRISRKG